MPSSYSPNLRLELQVTGENNATWGEKTNNNLTLLEQALAGTSAIALANADKTLTANFAASDESRQLFLKFTGALTAVRTVTVPLAQKLYVVQNATTEGFAINIKAAGVVPQVTIDPDYVALVYCDGSTGVAAIGIPTQTGKVAAAVVDSTAQAWRFDDAIGIGRAQPRVANYAVMSMNGATGSYTTYYANAVAEMTVSATTGSTGTADIYVPNKSFTITTGLVTPVIRFAVDNAGNTYAYGAFQAGSIGTTGTLTANFVTSATGYGGLTAGNVTGALGYTPANKAGDSFTGVVNFADDINMTDTQVNVGMTPTGFQKRWMAAFGDNIGFLHFDGSAMCYAHVPSKAWNAIGDIYSAANVIGYSDERLKTNWRPLPKDYLQQMHRVMWGVFDRTDIGITQSGVSAQSLQRVMPWAVSTDHNGTMGVNYGMAAMTLAMALLDKVAELEARLGAPGDAK